MNYIIEYDIAAIILSVTLLFLYFARGGYQVAANKIYIIMIGLTIIAPVADICSVYTIANAKTIPLWLNFFINIIYLLAYNGTAIVFFMYVLRFTGHNQYSALSRVTALGAVIVDCSLLITTPFTGLIIYFDENLQYNHGLLFPVLYGVGMFLLAYIVVIFFKNRHSITKYQSASICGFVFVMVFSVIVQILQPEHLISNFMASVFLLLTYVSLQNPDEFIDKTSRCLNTVAFLTVTQRYIRKEKTFSVVALTPDDFAYLNHSLGKESGDLVIKRIGVFLTKRFGKKRVFYLSDCRFAVIADEKFSVDFIVNDISNYFNLPFSFERLEITMKPYICIVNYPDFITSADDIRNAIDYCLSEFAPKQENYIMVASAESLDSKRRENKIVHVMRQAISDDSFEVYYQPIYSVKDKSFISAEALLRLNSEELGFISPDEFIPIAERTGMIIEIGELVVRRVCRFLKNSEALQLGIKYVEINLSAIQCMQDNLAERMIYIMKYYRVSTNQINFEITETAGMSSFDNLQSNMKRLVDMGSSFAMDDYGTGFSTATYLISLPMEIVKIDKSILWSAMKSKEALTVLTHTVKMLKELDKKIVVEGVETEQMASILTEMGCDYFQGFLYSRPVPPEKFVEFLEQNNACK